MIMWKQWIQRGVLCGLVLTGVGVFATTASAADSKPAITDHAGMASWYEKEAATNREKAKEMEAMKEQYAKHPAFVHSMAGGMGGVGGKTDIGRYAENLVSHYTKAAEEADGLAKMHRAMK